MSSRQYGDNSQWVITDLFPQFGEKQLRCYEAESNSEERAALGAMFEVMDVIDEKLSNFVVSTSLYCRPHDPEEKRINPITLENLQRPNQSVRGGSSWWETYFQPLLGDLDRIQPPWNLRIYLAEELKLLIPYLRHSRVEIWIMKHPSEFTIPGMLWRYLPLEEGVTLLARGADSLWPHQDYWDLVKGFSGSSCRFLRRFLPRDLDATGSLIYRSIPGPLLAKAGEPVRYIDFAKAWIWYQKRGLWPRSARLPWLPCEAPKFGLEHWAKYGQDEQFLSHYLYYRACTEGLYTVVDRAHRSVVVDYDRSFMAEQNASSAFIELGDPPKPSPTSSGRKQGSLEKSKVATPNPVFIVGRPRSGTTFMWSFLVGFRDVVEPFVRSDFKGKGQRFLPDGKWATSESGCFVGDFNAGVVAFTGALASCRKAFLVEKSPAHTRLSDRISESFPDAIFLYMTRPIEERYRSFNRHWPIDEEKFYADDEGWSPPEGTFERLIEAGRLLRVPFGVMKEESTLQAVCEFVFGPGECEFREALSYAESRPVGLPWAQKAAGDG